MIQTIKGMYKLFLREPLWFKILISSTLFVAIVLSSSFFSDGYYHSVAKLAAAVFFTSYGIKFRRNTRISVMFFALAVLCFYLSWGEFPQASL